MVAPVIDFPRKKMSNATRIALSSNLAAEALRESALGLEKVAKELAHLREATDALQAATTDLHAETGLMKRIFRAGGK